MSDEEEKSLSPGHHVASNQDLRSHGSQMTASLWNLDTNPPEVGPPLEHEDYVGCAVNSTGTLVENTDGTGRKSASKNTGFLERRTTPHSAAVDMVGGYGGVMTMIDYEGKLSDPKDGKLIKMTALELNHLSVLKFQHRPS